MAKSRLAPALWLVGLVVAFFAAQFAASALAHWLKLGALASASMTQAGLMLVAVVFPLIDGGGFRSLGVFTAWKGFDVAVIPGVLILHIVGSLMTMVVLMVAGLYDPQTSQGAMDTFSNFGQLETGSLALTALGLSLQAGIGEELLFRGYVVTRLERLGLKPWVCILLSALIFGLVHVPGYGWAASLPKAIWLGIPTAAYFWYRRNLGPLIVAHAFLDFSLFMLLGLILKLTGGQLPAMP
ncbi:MAG TPA: type II CAAX endopeptidase family protein [Symbiobacteriaceae bacterium]|nr:type II CAAX endopeptidase family protein [Symbiobacteriaceae bacterium]